MLSAGNEASLSSSFENEDVAIKVNIYDNKARIMIRRVARGGTWMNVSPVTVLGKKNLDMLK